MEPASDRIGVTFFAGMTDMLGFFYFACGTDMRYQGE